MPHGKGSSYPSGSPSDEGGAATKNWVKFDEADAPSSSTLQSAEASPKRAPSPTHPGAVASARGTVNSLAHAQQLQQHQQQQQQLQQGSGSTSAEGTPQISVGEIQVVTTNEQSLPRKSLPVHPLHHHQPSNGVNRVAAVLDNSTMEDVDLDNDTSCSPQPSHLVPGKQFDNGEVIVTVMPVNERFPWVMPARFRPELVPEELMATSLTLTVEEYVQAMQKLTTDMRFSLYNMFYKRILVIWITVAFIILMALLFSGFQGIALFACGVVWLILNAGAIFLCMWAKLKLNKQMEKCMAFINSSLMRHNILLGLDDRGRISCHKVNLCFLYMDSGPCIKKLEALLEEKPEEAAQGGEVFNREAYLKDVENFEDVEVVVPGRNSVRVNRKRERAERLYLHYIQRWAKDYLRRRLDWALDDLYGRAEYQSNTDPRHIRTALCPCQYIEEHLKNKRHRESLNPCSISYNPCLWCD